MSLLLLLLFNIDAFVNVYLNCLSHTSLLFLLPCSSLELFFASSQNNKLLYGEPPTSPRASRKFSSPPPLSITKTSSPNRRRKLSLNIPIITGGKALDLAALSCSPNGYASMHSTMSPFSKTTLDINKLYVSSTMASKISDDGEAKAEGKTEEPVLNKQGQNQGNILRFNDIQVHCGGKFCCSAVSQ